MIITIPKISGLASYYIYKFQSEDFNAKIWYFTFLAKICRLFRLKSFITTILIKQQQYKINTTKQTSYILNYISYINNKKLRS